MKILEYDQVDALGVFQVTMLASGFPLTPEHAAHLRRTDPRPLPCLSLCAVQDGVVIGHVGISGLPMLTSEGREDVGGIWAVSTHPQYTGRGVAYLLLTGRMSACAPQDCVSPRSMLTVFAKLIAYTIAATVTRI